MAFWEKPKNEEAKDVTKEVAKDVTLSGLYAVLGDSQAKIAEYLLKREAEAQAEAAQKAAAPSALTAEQFQRFQIPVLERLDAIGQMLGVLQGELPKISAQLQELPPQVSQQVLQQLPAQTQVLSQNLPPMADGMGGEGSVPAAPAVPTLAIPPQAQTSAPPQAPIPPLPPVVPQAPPVSAGVDASEFEMALLGSDLVAVGSISDERRQLMDGLMRAKPEAMYFVGLWLMFQAAATEKKALLLKDLGEAFYRWTATLPNGPETLESVFVPQVQAVCEQAGLQNTIELVHFGQRFDNARHTSLSRGVEVVRVKGWVVLRSNGSVYAKALVDVR